MLITRKQLTDAGIVFAGMFMGGFVGVLLSFCAFTATTGQADFTTLFVFGFTTLFIRVFAKASHELNFGYLKSVLLPAALWIGIYMIGTNRQLGQRMFYNSLASFVIVSVLYVSISLIRKNQLRSMGNIDSGTPPTPS
jgi:hypothetical protein